MNASTASSISPVNASQVVQDLYAAFGRADLPAFLALLSPNVSWRFIGAPGLAYSTEVHGHDGMQRWLTAVAAAEDIQAFEPREVFAANNHVTVLGWERTQARSSGRIFECEWMHLFVVESGKVSRFVGLYDSAPVAAAHASAQL